MQVARFLKVSAVTGTAGAGTGTGDHGTILRPSWSENALRGVANEESGAGVAFQGLSRRRGSFGEPFLSSLAWNCIGKRTYPISDCEAGSGVSGMAGYRIGRQRFGRCKAAGERGHAVVRRYRSDLMLLRRPLSLSESKT